MSPTLTGRPLVAFDVVPYDIFICKLEKDGFEGWIRNCLDGLSQRIAVKWLYAQVRDNDKSCPSGVCLGMGIV